MQIYVLFSDDYEKKLRSVNMIKNYKQYIKESLLDKLQGPSMDEIWKNLGYDKSINTPEEYFNEVFENLKFSENELYKKWKDPNGFLVIEYNLLSNFMRCWLGEYTDIMESIFDLTYGESKKIIINILRKKLKLKDDIEIIFIYDTINYEDADYYDINYEE